MIDCSVGSTLDVSVILPTYNERDNICDLIDALRDALAPTGCRHEIIVMDDNSPDGTADILRQRYLLGPTLTEQTQLDLCTIRLHVRMRDKGLAKAIRDGIEQAQACTLVVMDTDFNHDPAMIPQMMDLLRYYDLVVGSRFVVRGGMEDIARYRLSFLYNMFIRLLFHTQIQDHLSGFFAVRRNRLFQLESKFDRIFFGYGDYFIRLLLAAWRNNWKILEVPVFYILRRHGASKTGFWPIFRDYTKAVLKLRLFGL